MTKKTTTAKKSTKKKKPKQSALEKKFWASTPAARRVMIAQDVIAQLKARKYRAYPGVYLRKGDGQGINTMRFKLDDQIRDHLPAKCTVCGLGGLFVSCVRVANRVTVKDLADNFDTIGTDYWFIDLDDRHAWDSKYLAKFFSHQQIDWIEDAFEVWAQGSTDCESFGEQFANPKDRLLAIMENIVSNRGRFDPRRGKHKITGSYDGL